MVWKIRNSDLRGPIRPILKWLYYPGHRVASLAQSSGGSIKAIMEWLYMGGQ